MKDELGKSSRNFKEQLELEFQNPTRNAKIYVAETIGKLGDEINKIQQVSAIPIIRDSHNMLTRRLKN